MGNDRIIIKGNKEGLNAIINIDKFGNFEEMLDALIEKLSKGKKFYKGSTLCITTKLSSLTEKDVESLKVVLFEEIGIKDIVFEDKDIKDKESESKIFNGVYEGRTKFIRKTVRGGQCVDFQGNIVIVGDVNSGAEVYAGGNIIVLGSIKGNVYAGVGGNRITISPDDFEKPKYPEVAKVKDDAIIVEPYLTNKYIY